jgi:hypothetical protein
VGNYLLSAILYHLIRNLDKESRHLVRSVVETGDSVNHLDRIHQRGQSLDYLLGCSRIERLDKLLQRGEILDVVLGLVELVSEGQIEPLETEHEFVDILLSLFLPLILLVLNQGHFDHVEVLVFELFGPVGDSLHSFLPELQFSLGAWLHSFVLRLGFGAQKPFDGLDPVIEFFLEPLDPLALCHALQSLQFFRFNFEMFLSRLHQFESLVNFFLKLLSLQDKLFLGIRVSESPVVLFTID